MRRCKRLAVFLVAVLMLSMVCSQPGVIEVQAAAKKNNITKVGIKALPKNNTIELGEYFNFDPVILNTEEGKGKATTGVVYFEVNGKTNTAGVQSARWGNIYPVYVGQFDIRAVAFANSNDMRTWLAARKANGYVEDPKAVKYVTAYSDWETIKVTSEEEGLAVARWQKQLDLALKNKNVSNVLFATDSEKEFTLKKGNYRYKSITIDAPNADIVNEGRFKEITVEQIKSSTFYEKALGNKFIVKAPNASFHVEKDAVVGELVYRPAASSTSTPKLNIFGNGGSINKVSIAARGEVNIDGNTENTVPVVVEETAEGTVLNTNIQLNLNVNASIKLDVGALATNTVVNLLKAVEAVLSGAAENLNVNVSKEAEGAVVKTETAVTIKAEANVKIELGEGAEGSEITTGADVTVEVKNDTTEDVNITDNNGNSTTVEKGEEAVPTVTPTNTPSNPTVPSTTPNPTSIPAQVKVTKITVTSEGDVTVIEQNQTLQLKATVEPDNATNKDVTWKSADPTIATVDENGLVTGVGVGAGKPTTIIAEAADGSSVRGTFEVTVTEKAIEVIKAEAIEITSDGDVKKLAPKGTLQLTANVKPDNATNKTVTWESDTPAIATVDENGLVTGVSIGEAVITATANDGSGVKNEITLNVTNDVILVTEISITSENNITEIVEGGNLQLNAVVKPDNATNKKVEWSSNNTSVATVNSETGVVTGVKGGNVTITAKAMDGSGKEGSIEITVTSTPTPTPTPTPIPGATAELSGITYTVDSSNGQEVKFSGNSKTIIIKLNHGMSGSVVVNPVTTNNAIANSVTANLTNNVTEVKINVTSEDGTKQETYTVYFFVNPVEKVEITGTITGSAVGATGSAINLQDGVMNVTGATGQSVTLTATNIPDLGSTTDISVSYQWYQLGTNDTATGTILSGATEATYTLPEGTSGRYYVEVTVTLTKNSVSASHSISSRITS